MVEHNHQNLLMAVAAAQLAGIECSSPSDRQLPWVFRSAWVHICTYLESTS